MCALHAHAGHTRARIAQAGPFKTLPGQAGGIVTMFIDFVTLSQPSARLPVQINPAQGAALERYRQYYNNDIHN